MADPKRPVLRYHGGKWRLAPWIIGHFPAHRVYTEAFGGAGSVLMRKQRAELVEVFNDLDGEIVNLFRILRDPSSSRRLCEVVALTPYSREEFALSYKRARDPVEQARRTVVRAFQGFGSDSASGAQTGFRSNGNRQNRHPARDWTNYPAEIATFADRLTGVVIEHRAGAEVIQQHDAPATLHYVDPPYVLETRSVHTRRTGKGYRHEMSAADHRGLADVLRAATGMVVLSGYACPLYDELYADWERVTRAVKADGNGDRVEVLWLNRSAADRLGQHSLSLGGAA